MSQIEYLCPHCRARLAAVTEGSLDAWSCPEGHGVGITLSETYGQFQEDEIRAIWKAASTAPTSSLLSPAMAKPMVAVTLLVDDDEIEGNEGPGARLVTLDVAPDEQFLWFEVVDFETMPADLPNPPPSTLELARLEEVRADAAADVVRQAAARETELDRLAHRFGSRADALLGLSSLTKKLGRIGRS
jgi:hypothetical protein